MDEYEQKLADAARLARASYLDGRSPSDILRETVSHLRSQNRLGSIQLIHVWLRAFEIPLNDLKLATEHVDPKSFEPRASFDAALGPLMKLHRTHWNPLLP